MSHETGTPEAGVREWLPTGSQRSIRDDEAKELLPTGGRRGVLIRDADDLNMPLSNKKVYRHPPEGCGAVVKWAGVRESR